MALWLSPAAAAAQAQVQVHVAVPTVRFEVAPPLVVVSPGVQVVPDYDEEVFFVEGWYWCRWDGGWYRARDYRGGWVVVEPRYVPPTLVRIPPGKYKHHHGRVEKMRVHERGGRVREVKIKEREGQVTEIKVKEKEKEKRGHGRWK